ncbi:MAG: phosphonate ABC transporter, permease protein PhnE [Pseudomonadota bacterium]
MSNNINGATKLPPRLRGPRAIEFIAYVLAIAFFIVSLSGTEWSMIAFVEGIPNLMTFLSEAFPPSLTRLQQTGSALLETFQMALVGTVMGVLISLPLAIFAAKNLAPHWSVYQLSRGLIALARTVPDLIWALIFVIMVGLGPFAGTLAIMVDTLGFCARFFAESMEEADPGPQEALTAMGASPTSKIFCAVIPDAMPSFINVSLFALEKATRSSVILGLVGAGGIGIELKVSMDMFEYSQAATIILSIFILVIIVEQLSGGLRRKIL